MRKKFIVYYHKLPLCEDPFKSFKEKRLVYHDLFQRALKRGHDMYLASGRENCLGNYHFANVYRYNTAGFFEPHHESVQADAIYDRSGGIDFPSPELSKKTLNARSFKLLCNDKNATKELLGDFMPKSFAIQNSEELRLALQWWGKRTLAVLKPAKGMQGEGILIDTPEKIALTPLDPSTSYVLQEFVDTSMGIPGITDRHHDLRIIIVNGQIILAHVRNPKEGSLLANVAQGGSLQEVPVKNIPPFILETVKKIQLLIDSTFDSPLYSIDFGIQHSEHPFVFELNDQIGFPRENMTGSKLFIEGILDSLELRATR